MFEPITQNAKCSLTPEMIFSWFIGILGTCLQKKKSHAQIVGQNCTVVAKT